MKIIFEDIKLFAFHGWYAEEQQNGHWFSINIEVETKDVSVNNDDLSETFNYEIIYKICVEELGNTQKLLETVNQNIINRLANEVSIQKIKLNLFKHAPHKMEHAGKVGIENNWSRD